MSEHQITSTSCMHGDDASVHALSNDTLRAVRDYVNASKADNTLRGYRSDWRHFRWWCESKSVAPLPALPESVAAYLADCAEHLKASSLQRRLNAIAEAHKAAGLEPPTHHPLVVATYKGIKRRKGTLPVQKAAALTEDIRAMVYAAGQGMIDLRNKAVILLGFAGAFRRGEIVNLDVSDCVFNRDGLIVTIRRSKTDQEGAGRTVGIPYASNPTLCPIRVLQDWIEHGNITAGALFRSVDKHGHVRAGRLSGIDVARIVKKLAVKVGLDPRKYAGHSLRAGHATSAAIGGASERAIIAQTGHKSVQMVRRYIRDGNLFRDNSAAKLGL